MTVREKHQSSNIEELEVLQSIYDGDDNFKEVNTNTFQYKYGEANSYKALMVEIEWGESYPEEPPTVNMDLFYNKNIIDSVKEKIKAGVLEQAQDLLDSAMTYSLFEWVKENYEDLVSEQPDAPQLQTKVEEKQDKQEPQSQDVPSKKKEKKEQLTKNQKRRLYEKMGNATGEMPRGWNWVDIVKHLSQTGSQKD